MPIARYFIGEPAEEGGAFLAFAPARDLSQEEYDALPDYAKKAVDGSDLYRKTKPKEQSKPARAPADTEGVIPQDAVQEPQKAEKAEGGDS